MAVAADARSAVDTPCGGGAAEGWRAPVRLCPAHAALNATRALLGAWVPLPPARPLKSLIRVTCDRGSRRFARRLSRAATAWLCHGKGSLGAALAGSCHSPRGFRQRKGLSSVRRTEPRGPVNSICILVARSCFICALDFHVVGWF